MRFAYKYLRGFGEINGLPFTLSASLCDPCSINIEIGSVFKQNGFPIKCVAKYNRVLIVIVANLVNIT